MNKPKLHFLSSESWWSSVSKALGLLGVLGLSACGIAKRQSGSQLQEAWDVRNRPEIMGIPTLRYEELTPQKARRGALAQKPWADDYWPFYRKGMAYRYAIDADFPNFGAQIADAKAHAESPVLAPSEKYDILMNDANFLVTADSWNRYTTLNNRFPNQTEAWNWMGICSGWSPASINEPAPEHAVLAKNSAGKSVLFFEGDLRGLMSKAYDMNALTGGTRTIGSRCDSKSADIPHDASGRPVDGMFPATDMKFFIVRDYSSSLGALLVSDNAAGTNPYWIVAKDKISQLEGELPVYIYDNGADVQADRRANTIGQRARSAAVSVQFYKACRDVNAGSFHLALVNMLSDAQPAKTPFIVELSRQEQVWNFPLWGFSSQIDPPVAVGQDEAATRPFRAPGTAYVANVHTRLVYSKEVGRAQVEYHGEQNAKLDWEHIDADSLHYGVQDLFYSLEFDANGFVVGGEWHETPAESPNYPDFFWRTYGHLTDVSKNGGASILRYSVLKKLLNCSLQNPDTEVDMNIPNGVSKVQAVTCQL